jgi:cytochrome c-type biogenesis protein CcmF
VVVIGGSLLLYAIRASQLKSVGRYEIFSREMMLMGNNVLLVAATIVVLLGTLLPLVHKELGMGTISIGAPFFNQMFTLLIVPFVVFMAIGPLSRWKKQAPSALRNQLLIAMMLGLSAGVLINFTYDEPTYMGMLGMVLSFWILIAVVLEVRQRVISNTREESIAASLKKLTPSHWGMVLGHVGFAITLIGITLVSNYELERDVRMNAGDTVKIADYSIKFSGVKQISGPNYTADRGIFDVYKEGEFVNHLEPEKRFYPVQRTSMTEAGIHTTLTRDLFIALGEPLSNNGWAVRLYYKPFVVWIWGGSFIMSIGGIFSMSDKRYRIKKMAKWKSVVGRGSKAHSGADDAASIESTQSNANLGLNTQKTAGEHSS